MTVWHYVFLLGIALMVYARARQRPRPSALSWALFCIGVACMMAAMFLPLPR
jgi:heme/copper-type cytochrome/quinol oxidase subunit 1